MAGAGMAVILAGGKRGLRPGGKAAVFNADGECPGCCQCEPFVLGSFTTNRYYNPCWDLTPYQGPGQAPPGSYWRLIEIGYAIPTAIRGTGLAVSTVKDGWGLPSQFCSNYYYDGYMELQIGCYDPTDNRIHWPGTCQSLSTRYSC